MPPMMYSPSKHSHSSSTVYTTSMQQQQFHHELYLDLVEEDDDGDDVIHVDDMHRGAQQEVDVAAKDDTMATFDDEYDQDRILDYFYNNHTDPKLLSFPLYTHQEVDEITTCDATDLDMKSGTSNSTNSAARSLHDSIFSLSDHGKYKILQKGHHTNASISSNSSVGSSSKKHGNQSMYLTHDSRNDQTKTTGSTIHAMKQPTQQQHQPRQPKRVSSLIYLIPNDDENECINNVDTYDDVFDENMPNKIDDDSIHDIVLLEFNDDDDEYGESVDEDEKKQERLSYQKSTKMHEQHQHQLPQTTTRKMQQNSNERLSTVTPTPCNIQQYHHAESSKDNDFVFSMDSSNLSSESDAVECSRSNMNFQGDEPMQRWRPSSQQRTALQEPLDEKSHYVQPSEMAHAEKQVRHQIRNAVQTYMRSGLVENNRDTRGHPDATHQQYTANCSQNDEYIYDNQEQLLLDRQTNTYSQQQTHQQQRQVNRGGSETDRSQYSKYAYSQNQRQNQQDLQSNTFQHERQARRPIGGSQYPEYDHNQNQRQERKDPQPDTYQQQEHTRYQQKQQTRHEQQQTRHEQPQARPEQQTRSEQLQTRHEQPQTRPEQQQTRHEQPQTRPEQQNTRHEHQQTRYEQQRPVNRVIGTVTDGLRHATSANSSNRPHQPHTYLQQRQAIRVGSAASGVSQCHEYGHSQNQRQNQKDLHPDTYQAQRHQQQGQVHRSGSAEADGRQHLENGHRQNQCQKRLPVDIQQNTYQQQPPHQQQRLVNRVVFTETGYNGHAPAVATTPPSSPDVRHNVIQNNCYGVHGRDVNTRPHHPQQHHVLPRMDNSTASPAGRMDNCATSPGGAIGNRPGDLNRFLSIRTPNTGLTNPPANVACSRNSVVRRRSSGSVVSGNNGAVRRSSLGSSTSNSLRFYDDNKQDDEEFSLMSDRKPKATPQRNISTSNSISNSWSGDNSANLNNNLSSNDDMMNASFSDSFYLRSIGMQKHQQQLQQPNYDQSHSLSQQTNQRREYHQQQYDSRNTSSKSTPTSTVAPHRSTECVNNDNLNFDVASPRRQEFQHQQQEQVQEQCSTESKGLESPSQPKKPMVEIFPGVYAELRGAAEAVEAIRNDFYIPLLCYCCETTVFCIEDADYVICPECRVITPTTTTTSSPTSITNAMQKNRKGGVGLGFTFEELQRHQAAIFIEENRHRVGSAQASRYAMRDGAQLCSI